jgi:hypothetical protein
MADTCGMPNDFCDSNIYINGEAETCSGCSLYKCSVCNGTGETCGLAWWIILLIVLGAVLVLVGLGYFGYRYYKKKDGYTSSRYAIIFFSFCSFPSTVLRLLLLSLLPKPTLSFLAFLQGKCHFRPWRLRINPTPTSRQRQRKCSSPSKSSN